MAPTKKIPGKKPDPVGAQPVTADPLDIRPRLYRQLGKLLDDMEAADRDETMTFPQRLNAMLALGRVLVMFSGLRKADADLGGTDPGSKARAYSAAFKAPYGARRRTSGAGSHADDDAGLDQDFDDGAA